MNAEFDGPSIYLNALRRVAPLIAEHRSGTDLSRQLAPPVFSALANADLFRLWLPRSLGGPELSPLEFMRVVEAASALDGSVGWLVGNGGGMSRAGGYLAPGIARQIFADPQTFITSSTGAVGIARPAPGGYRLSGRWPFGSGAPHATHFMALAVIGDAASPDQPQLCCYLPRDQVTMLDTWHVSGLRGTGSHDFSVDDAFVPEDYTHPFPNCRQTDPGLLYRMPARSVFAWTVAVVPLGIAQGAMNAFAQIANRTRLGTPARICDRETVNAVVGRNQVLYRSARALLAGAMADLMSATDSGQQLVEARVMLRAAAAHAAETAQAIVNGLVAEAGAIAIFESCPLERALRDVQAAAKHVAMNHVIYVAAGRVALGLDPGAIRF